MTRLSDIMSANNEMKSKLQEKFGDKVADMFPDVSTYVIRYLSLIYTKNTSYYDTVKSLVKLNSLDCDENQISEIANVIYPFIQKMKHL